MKNGKVAYSLNGGDPVETNNTWFVLLDENELGAADALEVPQTAYKYTNEIIASIPVLSGASGGGEGGYWLANSATGNYAYEWVDKNGSTTLTARAEWGIFAVLRDSSVRIRPATHVRRPGLLWLPCGKGSCKTL